MIILQIFLIWTLKTHAEESIEAIIKRFNIIEEGQCNIKSFEGLSAMGGNVPRERLQAFLGAYYDPEKLSFYILKRFGGTLSDTDRSKVKAYLELLDQPPIQKMLRKDSEIIKRCNKNEYSKYFVSMPYARQRAISELYSSLHRHIYHRYREESMGPYLSRILLRFVKGTKIKPPDPKTMDEKIQAFLTKRVAESREEEAMRKIPESERDRFAFVHSDLSEDEIKQIGKIYKTDIYQYVYMKFSLGLADVKVYNMEKYLAE